MRKYLICTLICLSILNLSAQNLVPNWSLEQYDTCPYQTTQICFASGWFQPITLSGGSKVCSYSTSEYFNQCNSSGPFSVDVPYNAFGFQYAKTGDGYAGILVYADGYNYREYIEAKLTDSLLVGKKYCVEFFVSLANGSTHATDAMGIFFSKDSTLTTNTKVLPYIPQVSNLSGNFLADTLDWMQISGEYVAGGGEIFITIGNFVDSANINIVQVVNPLPSTPGIYYYIDDVSVYFCDSIPEIDSTIYVPNAFSPNGDGENEVFFVQGSLEELHCEIFTRWGERVAELMLPRQGWDGRLNGLECNTGVYFYYLTAKDKKGNEITAKGNITLLR